MEQFRVAGGSGACPGAPQRVGVLRHRRGALRIGWLLPTAVAGALSFACQAADFPPVRIVDETILYPIQGDSVRRIRDQLRNHGPWAAGVGQGRTRSEFEVRTEFEPRADGCHLVGLKLVLRITTTLPEWQPGRRATSALRAEWQVAHERPLRHEAGHRQHAVDAAHELHGWLLRIPAQENCLRAQWTVDDHLRKAISRLRQRGMIYDDRTANGLAEPLPTP